MRFVIFNCSDKLQNIFEMGFLKKKLEKSLSGKKKKIWKQIIAAKIKFLIICQTQLATVQI